MYALVVTCTRTCLHIAPSQSPLCCLWQLLGSQGGRKEQNCPLLQSQHASALYAEAEIRTFLATVQQQETGSAQIAANAIIKTYVWVQ